MSRNIEDNPFLYLAYQGKYEEVREIIINNSLDNAVKIIVQMIADSTYND